MILGAKFRFRRETVWKFVIRHRKSLATIGLLAVVASSLLSDAERVTAGSIVAGETRIISNDPGQIDFRISIEAEAGLASSRFNFKVLSPTGNVGGAGDANFVAARKTDVTFVLETNTSTRYIPVGSEFVIWWELIGFDGSEKLTDEERFIFLDGQYDWKSRTQGQVTVFWYGNNDSNANAAFEAASATIADGEALLETDVPYPVKVMVWASESDGELARQPRGSTFDSQVVTGGQRVAPDLIYVFTPNIDVIRHETAHIVTKVAGDGPFTRIPAWLDEGTAMYLQKNVSRDYDRVIKSAVRNDTTLNLRSLQAPVNEARLVNLFYGQSWSTVVFMIDAFGEEAFSELYRIVKAGSTIDVALQSVYGVSQDGLYNLWRNENGLVPIDFALRGTVTPEPISEATRVPLVIPTAVVPAPKSGVATAAGETTSGNNQVTSAGDRTSHAESDGSTATIGLIVGLVTLLIVGLLVGGVVTLLRKG